jgi:tetratricopeptide (TPR) repeat protein
MKSDVIFYALDLIRAQAEARPNDARVFLWYSLLLHAGGDREGALAAVKHALELSPSKQQLLVQAGHLSLQLDDFKGAHEFFEKAYALSPDKDELLLYAAAGRIVSGDKAGGEELLLMRFGTTTVDSDVLLYAYFDAGLYPAAVSMLTRRMETDATAMAGFQLASVYTLTGDKTAARSVINDTIVKHPEAKAQAEALIAELGL